MKLLDSTFLIDLLRNDQKALQIVRKDINFLTTQINMFELLSGLLRHDVTKSNLPDALELFENIRILPLDDAAVLKSAEISAELIKNGNYIGDSDCLIAGCALSKGISTIITRNKRHYQRIEGISVETY